MPYSNILVDIEDHVMILTINRPAKMNALDSLTHREMAQAMDNFVADETLWVAIVTGAGDETLRFWNVFPTPKSKCFSLLYFLRLRFLHQCE